MSADSAQGPPPTARLMEMITGHWVTAALHAAAQLGLADHLQAGPLRSEELGNPGRHASSATYRLLRALASQGLFVEDDQQRFALTELGQFLRADHPQSVRDLALFQGAPPHWQGWGNLLHSIRTGESAFEHVHGQGFFDYCQTDPEFAAAFNGAMTGMTAANAQAVCQAYDFSDIEHLADVGGGHGLLLVRILEANPHLQGTVVDLPHVVSGALAAIRAAGLADRCQTCGADFFRDSLPAADAFLAKHIVHDWDDEHSIRILANMRQHLKPGGRVLLVESVIEPGNAPSMAKWLDMEMLHATHGGRERTEEEFAQLFAAAGLNLQRVHKTASLSCIIEGRP